MTRWQSSFFALGSILIAALSACSPQQVVRDDGTGTEEGGSIRGTAQMENQTAHGGIFIALLGTDRSATTDDTGHYTLTGIPAGTYKLEARADGYTPAQIADVKVSTTAVDVAPILLHADEGAGSVSGSILVPGATDHGGTQVYLEGTSSVAFTATNGRFRLEHVPSGTYVLAAKHEGFRDARVEGVEVTNNGTATVAPITLSPSTGPTGAISGVITLDGASINNGGVIVYLAGTSLTALTAADGSYTLSPVLPGAYEVVAAKTGYVNRSIPNLQVAAGETTRAPTLDLPRVGPNNSPFGSVSGRVTLDGASTGNGGVIVYLAGTSYVAYTDASGAYAIPEILPGTYEVVAMKSGFDTKSQANVDVFAGMSAQVSTLDLKHAGPANSVFGEVSGRATLDGASAGNAGIIVYLAGTSSVAYTDNTGAYTISNVLPGTYEVVAVRTGYNRASSPNLSVQAGQIANAPLLDLKAGSIPGTSGSVVGRALLLGRASHAGIAVALTSGGASTGMQTTTDATGAYRFDNVPAGVYEVALSSSPFQPLSIPNVTAAAGVFRVPDATLSLGKRLDSRPLSWASVIPNDSKVLLGFKGAADPATQIYDTGSGSFTQVAARTVEVRAVSANGRYATVWMSGAGLFRADLATGDLDPVTPAATYVVQELGKSATLYQNGFNDWYVLRVGETTGTLIAPCVSGYQGISQVKAAGVGTPWYSIRSYSSCIGNGNQLTRLYNVDTGATNAFAAQSATDPAGKSMLLLESDDTATVSIGPWTLRRLDLATNQFSVLKTNVNALYVASDFSFGRLSYDKNANTSRQSFASLNTATGVVTELATDASIDTFFSDQKGAALFVGSQRDVKVAEFTNGISTPLCTGQSPTLTFVNTTPNQNSVLFCLSGSNLSAYDRSSTTVRTLTTSYASAFSSSPNGRGVVWKESASYRATSIDSTATPLTLCSTTMSTKAFSPNGRHVVTDCNSGSSRNLVATDLLTGASSEVLPSRPSGVSIYGVVVDDSGRGVLVSYSVDSGSNPWSCPATVPDAYYCLAVYDRVSNTRTAFRTYMIGAPETAWSSDGKGGLTIYDVAVLQFQFSSGAPTIRTFVAPASSYPYPFAVGTGGRYALWMGSSGVTRSDVTSDTPITFSVNNTPVRLASSDEYLVGDHLLDLATGADVTLGSGVRDQRFSTDKSRLTFVEGTAANLKTHVAGGPITTLASSVRLLIDQGPDTLYLTGFDGEKGTLVRIEKETATLVTLKPNVGTRLASIDSRRYFAFQNPNVVANTGDLLLLTLASNSASVIQTQVRLTSTLWRSGERVAYHAAASGGASALYVSKLDGTKTTRLGDEASSVDFSTDSTRAFWISNGLWWAESTTSTPVAIDVAGAANLSGARASNGNFVLYSIDTNLTSEPARVGTYRIDLP